MIHMNKGRYTVRHASDEKDLSSILGLRAVCFGIAGGTQDPFDLAATQVMVEDVSTGQIVATFRMALLAGAEISNSYAAQFYDLSPLAAFDGPMLELGRFCVRPDHSDPDILRIAWAGLTAYVDAQGVEMLFGCSSFAGTSPEKYIDAFALLKARHLAPAQWSPRVKSPDVFEYAAQLQGKPDLAKANTAMPPLLRTYLMMGGWVSDHAVIDPVMDTLHVFTGLEIGSIPPERKKLLRALV
jgi:putative hemolysin